MLISYSIKPTSHLILRIDPRSAYSLSSYSSRHHISLRIGPKSELSNCEI
jgi:hypothetical protein